MSLACDNHYQVRVQRVQLGQKSPNVSCLGGKTSMYKTHVTRSRPMGREYSCYFELHSCSVAVALAVSFGLVAVATVSL